MAAKETVIGKFVNQILFKVDPNSVKQAQQTVTSFKQFATKTLGALGIGLSLAFLRGITEEFGGINDQINGATEGLGNQVEIQQKILKAAQDCRETYGSMADYTTELVQKNQNLFPVDDAVRFASIIEKLEKGAGKEKNIGTSMSLMTKAASSGKMDKTGFAQLNEKAPEVVQVLELSLGKSKAQLESMAAAGTLTAKTIKEAFFNAETDIQKKFDNLDLSITDALTHIRNGWGYWLEQIDSTYKITDKVSRFIIEVGDKCLGKAKQLTDWLDKAAEKLGGHEKILKFIALAAASIFLAMNGGKILAFLQGALGLLKGINTHTALAAAKWLLLFLVIEDIFTFLQGGDSIIGRLLEDAGVDVDELRENIHNFFEDAKAFGGEALDALRQFWEEHGQSVVGVFQWLWGVAVALIQVVMGLFHGVLDDSSEAWNDFLTGLDNLGAAVFGSLWDPMKESAQALWDWLTGFFDWIGDRVKQIRGAWTAVKNFFTGGSSEDEQDTDKKDSTKTRSSKWGGAGRSTSTSTDSKKAVSDFVSAGQAASTKTVNAPVNRSTKNITVRQENNQKYTFQVSDRQAADKLQREVSTQGTQSANQLAHTLNFGG